MIQLSAEPPHAANAYDVMIYAIQAISAIVTMVVTPLLTVYLTKRRLEPQVTAAAADARAARVAAVDAVAVTVEGNEAVAEVHKVVNGKNDALRIERDRAMARVAELEAQLGQRRADDL